MFGHAVGIAASIALLPAKLKDDGALIVVHEGDFAALFDDLPYHRHESLIAAGENGNIARPLGLDEIEKTIGLGVGNSFGGH